MSSQAHILAKHLVNITKGNPSHEARVMTEFVNLLDHYQLLHYKDAIVRHLEHFRNQEDHQNTLYITSKERPSEKLIDTLRDRLGAPKDSTLEITTPKEAVGGLVAEYQGRVLDASIETLLHRLTHSLTE